MKKRVQLAAALLTLGITPGTIAAQESHVVPLPELHDRAVAATRERDRNLEDMNRFFSSEAVAARLRSAKLDPKQLGGSLNRLSDAELARLAERARQVQSEFAAGSLNNEQLTYIVIALGTAVLILVVVAS